MKSSLYIVLFVFASINLMAQEESIINSDQKMVIDFPKVELSIQDGVNYSNSKESKRASELLMNPLHENNSYADLMAQASNLDPNCVCPINNYKIGFLMRKLMRSETED